MKHPEEQVNDDELALIAAQWWQLPRGRWTHPMFQQGPRTRSFTLDDAILEAARLLPAKDPAPAWCGVEQPDEPDA